VATVEHRQRDADRDRIRSADPIAFLISVIRGEPLPVRDAAGEVTGYERVEAPVRVAAAERLLRKIVPDLKAVDITGDGAGITFRIESPFALPGSHRTAQIDATIPTDELDRLREIAVVESTIDDRD
jgi:hypothetical protein